VSVCVCVCVCVCMCMCVCMCVFVCVLCIHSAPLAVGIELCFIPILFGAVDTQHPLCLSHHAS